MKKKNICSLSTCSTMRCEFWTMFGLVPACGDRSFCLRSCANSAPIAMTWFETLRRQPLKICVRASCSSFPSCKRRSLCMQAQTSWALSCFCPGPRNEDSCTCTPLERNISACRVGSFRATGQKTSQMLVKLIWRLRFGLCLLSPSELHRQGFKDLSLKFHLRGDSARAWEIRFVASSWLSTCLRGGVLPRLNSANLLGKRFRAFRVNFKLCGFSADSVLCRRSGWGGGVGVGVGCSDINSSFHRRTAVLFDVVGLLCATLDCFGREMRVVPERHPLACQSSTERLRCGGFGRVRPS